MFADKRPLVLKRVSPARLKYGNEVDQLEGVPAAPWRVAETVTVPAPVSTPIQTRESNRLDEPATKNIREELASYVDHAIKICALVKCLQGNGALAQHDCCAKLAGMRLACNTLEVAKTKAHSQQCAEISDRAGRQY